MELINIEEKITRALLVSADTGSYDAEISMDELCELVKSASDSSDPKQTYIHLIPPCPHHTDKCFCNADSIAQHRSKIN